MAMVMADLRLEAPKPVIPTLPPDKAPKAAPNRLLGSFNRVIKKCLLMQRNGDYVTNNTRSTKAYCASHAYY